MSKHKTFLFFAVGTLTYLNLFSSPALAWGRRGHSLVGETAAYLASTEPNAFALRNHAYDLGYYCNTPDFFWKKPATYALERPQHYMDMEQFTREFAAHPEIKHPFEMSRAEFQAAFPQIKPDAGGGFWRVREFTDQMMKYSDQLKAMKTAAGPERQALQAKWILLAGLVGHYVGDLAQPLHTTENHDGSLTKQDGIHSFFEDTCVDEAYPRLVTDVNELARRRWPDFRSRHTKASVLELVEELARESNATLPELFSIDRRHPREKMPAACAAFRKMITERIAQGSLVLAEIYRRTTGWTFDDNRFYFFRGQPDYIMPGPISAD